MQVKLHNGRSGHNIVTVHSNETLHSILKSDWLVPVDYSWPMDWQRSYWMDDTIFISQCNANQWFDVYSWCHMAPIFARERTTLLPWGGEEPRGDKIVIWHACLNDMPPHVPQAEKKHQELSRALSNLNQRERLRNTWIGKLLETGSTAGMETWTEAARPQLRTQLITYYNWSFRSNLISLVRTILPPDHGKCFGFGCWVSSDDGSNGVGWWQQSRLSTWWAQVFRISLWFNHADTDVWSDLESEENNGCESLNRTKKIF